MLTRAEFLRGSYGAWRLLLGDRHGLEWIDRSPLGAWRSFLLAPILYPLNLAGSLLVLSQLPTAPSIGHIMVVDVIIYTIGWVAYPLLLLWIAPLLGRDRQILGYISVSNWTSVVTTAVGTILALLLSSGLASDGLNTLLFFAQIAFLFGYGWFVARAALDLRPLPAAGLSLLQIAIGFFLSQIMVAMLL
jgi:hypothetical protein